MHYIIILHKVRFLKTVIIILARDFGKMKWIWAIFRHYTDKKAFFTLSTFLNRTTAKTVISDPKIQNNAAEACTGT